MSGRDRVRFFTPFWEFDELCVHGSPASGEGIKGWGVTTVGIITNLSGLDIMGTYAKTLLNSYFSVSSASSAVRFFMTLRKS